METGFEAHLFIGVLVLKLEPRATALRQIHYLRGMVQQTQYILRVNAVPACNRGAAGLESNHIVQTVAYLSRRAAYG
jgi:hypothetical protein